MAPETAPPIESLFIVGSGIMGSGIAAVALAKGLRVHLYDVKDTYLDKGMATVQKHLQKMATRGGIPADQVDKAFSRLLPTLNLEDAGTCDFVIEAAPEVLETKKEIFHRLDAIAPSHAILGTNTSSLSITLIASVVRDPGRVVGIHFFNPVPAMELVELIAGGRTRPETLERARQLSTLLGKTVTASRDFPGFITTRSIGVLINEAVWMLHEGVASREDIDTAHKLGFHHPMGPLELADLVGLDTALAILERLYTGFRDPKYRACPLLVQMVEAGKLGRKSGEGFYSYR